MQEPGWGAAGHAVRFGDAGLVDTDCDVKDKEGGRVMHGEGTCWSVWVCIVG
jgi:hypothetical protein